MVPRWFPVTSGIIGGTVSSIRLDYFPYARPLNLKARWGRPKGKFTCEECGRTLKRTASNQKCCKRKACQFQRNQKANQRNKRKVLRPRLDDYIEPLPPPQCVCGAMLKFGSDPMTGSSIEYCPHCGERPLQILGRRVYDQRARIEAELRERQDRVDAPVDPGARERSAGRTQHVEPLRWGAGLLQGKIA